MRPYETPLATYDLVFGVSQNALNFNLEYIFGQFSDDQAWLKFGDVWSDDSEDDAALHARMAAPRLDFIHGNATQARVTLTFDSAFRPTAEDLIDARDGKAPAQLAVNVFSRVGGTRRKPLVECHDCTDWRLVFDVDLNYAEYDPETTQIPASIKAKLTAFKSEMFSVQQIFLDLTNVNVLSVAKGAWVGDPVVGGADAQAADKHNMKLASILLEAQKIVAQTLAARQQGRQDSSLFTLAFPVAKKKLPAYPAALFEPTGCVHATKKFTDAAGAVSQDPKLQGLATLNFLLNTDHRPVERKVQTHGVFDTKNLVTNPQSHGTAIITRKQLDEKFVMRFWEAIMGSLASDVSPSPIGGADTTNDKQQTTEAGQPWLFNYDRKVYADAGGDDKDYYDDQRSFTLQRVNHGADVELAGSGFIALEIKREYHDSLFKGYQGKVWKSARSEIRFSVRLAAGEDGKVIIRPGLDGGQAFQIGEPVTDDSKTGVVAFVDKIGLWSTGDLLSSITSRLTDIKTKIDEAVDQKLVEQMNQLGAMVVFPAPGVFFYSRLQFSEHGDLEMQLQYKS